ncbi:unnamed protein product [Eruca vesicaria subsp. sativa]|uniref:Uncharacterized protein n=1 Tax=Eruca vesicaria subsp. sativa TaxID=29727 RepID=A0ABC8L013_ERUVS|nr:unnamed protein product [Eruca vesicaria subsp. sativa]
MEPAQVPAHVVGRAFVMKYYEILHNAPQDLHRFYLEMSNVGRLGQDGVMRDFYTLDGIREELDTMSFGDFKSAEITSYHTQESHNGGFIVLVTGWFTLKEGTKRKFTQTFFLAPQENGYFVLNDILGFDDEPEALVEDGSETPCPITAPTGGIQGSEQAACVSVDSVCQEVSKPLNNDNASVATSKPLDNDNASVAKESILVPDSVNEEVPSTEITNKKVAGDSKKISDPDNGHENVSKKSYASSMTFIYLKVAKDKSGVLAASSLSPKQIPKNLEHQVTSDVSTEQKVKNEGHQVSTDLSPVEKSEVVSETVDETEYGFEVVGEGTSIYVRHLPGNANIVMLETEFKKFGAIGNGGIQVVNQKGFGFPYGFVEFKDADAAQKAIEVHSLTIYRAMRILTYKIDINIFMVQASPLMIGGQKAFIEEKRSTARGNRGSGYGNRNVGGSAGNEYETRNVGGDGYRNVGGRGGGRYGYGNNYNRGRGGGGGGRSFNRRGGYEYVASNNSY